jgi:hypothetical protein
MSSKSRYLIEAETHDQKVENAYADFIIEGRKFNKVGIRLHGESVIDRLPAQLSGDSYIENALARENAITERGSVSGVRTDTGSKWSEGYTVLTTKVYEGYLGMADGVYSVPRMPSVVAKEDDIKTFKKNPYKMTSKASVGNVRTLETLLGKVELQNEDYSEVCLESISTGRRFTARCKTRKLQVNGIREGDYFQCEIVEIGSSTRLVYKKVPPRELTEVDVGSIVNEADKLYSETFE